MDHDTARKLRELVKTPPPRPSADAFLDHFFALAGGPDKVAGMLYDEFNHAKPGSLIRSRVMEMVLRQLAKSEARQGPRDLGDLSEADIDRELVRRENAIYEFLEKSRAARHPAAADGQAAPAPAAEGGHPPGPPAPPAAPPAAG